MRTGIPRFIRLCSSRSWRPRTVSSRDDKFIGPVGLLIAAGFAAVMVITFGALSDRFGRVPVYRYGALFQAVIALPAFYLVTLGNVTLVWVVMVVGIALGVQSMLGPQCPLLPELFGSQYRFTGVAMSRELSAVLAGGLVPAGGRRPAGRHGSFLAGARPVLAGACADLVRHHVLHTRDCGTRSCLDGGRTLGVLHPQSADQRPWPLPPRKGPRPCFCVARRIFLRSRRATGGTRRAIVWLTRKEYVPHTRCVYRCFTAADIRIAGSLSGRRRGMRHPFKFINAVGLGLVTLLAAPGCSAPRARIRAPRNKPQPCGSPPMTRQTGQPVPRLRNSPARPRTLRRQGPYRTGMEGRGRRHGRLGPGRGTQSDSPATSTWGSFPPAPGTSRA